jgi:hypothetical protein
MPIDRMDSVQDPELERILGHMAEEAVGVLYTSVEPTVDTVPLGKVVVYDDGEGNEGAYLRTGKGRLVQIGGGIPSGGIIMWKGTIATIPAGWYLCDGTNGTPDFRDKFIVGAKEDDGGVAKTNVTGSLTQSGDGTIPSHTHTGPAHTHKQGAGQVHRGTNPDNGYILAYNEDELQDDVDVQGSTSWVYTETGGTGDTGTAGTGTKNIAVYYAAAFIMKA